MTAVATRPASPVPAVEVYRDDGPLARALAAGERAVPLPPVVLVGSAVLAIAVAIVVARTEASEGVVGAIVGWAILAGGVSSGRPHTDRLAWLTPVLLRATEYAGLLWLASMAGGNAVAATFALLCAVAFRQYDIVYRHRHRGAGPAWTAVISGGWDGRLLVGYLVWVAGVLTGAFFVAGAVLAVVLVAESALGWVRAARKGRRPMHEEDDDELGVDL
jgi:hypothetical protein